MSTFTPNELTYPVTPSAIDAVGLTTTYGAASRGSGFDLARDRGNVRRHIGLIGALTASVRAETCGALVATSVRQIGVWL